MKSLKRWSKKVTGILLSVLVMSCMPLQGAQPQPKSLQNKLGVLKNKLGNIRNQLAELRDRLQLLKYALKKSPEKPISKVTAQIATAEAKAKLEREEAEIAKRAADAKAKLEVEAARKTAEAKAKQEREEAEIVKRAADARAKLEREEAARKAAEAKAKLEREEAEIAKRAADAMAKLEAEAARKAAEAKAKLEREEAEIAKRAADARAKLEKEEAARKAAEAKAKLEREEAEIAKRAADAMAKLEAEAARKAAEAKAKLEKEEAEIAKRAADARAKLQVESARKAAEAKAKLEKEEAEIAKRAADARAKLEAEAARKAAEVKAKLEKEEAARKAAEAKAKLEKEEAEIAKRAADAKAKLEVESARKVAEAKAKLEREEADVAKRAAEAKANLEAEVAAAERAANEKAVALFRARLAEEKAKLDAEKIAKTKLEAEAETAKLKLAEESTLKPTSSEPIVITAKIIELGDRAKKLRAEAQDFRDTAKFFKSEGNLAMEKDAEKDVIDRDSKAELLEQAIKKLQEQLLANPPIQPVVLPGQQGVVQDVNAGLENAGGNDCFFSASFQILSQIDPFVKALEEMDKDGKTTEVQNEFLTFIQNLRERPLKAKSRAGNQYDPAGDATTKFRNYITKNSLLVGMRGSGQQDAEEFLSIFLDLLIGNNEELEKIFVINQQTKKTKNLQGPWSDSGGREKLRDLFLGIPEASPGRKLGLEDCLATYVAPEYLDDLVVDNFSVGGYKKTLLLAKSKAPLPKVLVITFRRLMADWTTMTAKRLMDAVTFPLHFNKQYLRPYVDGDQLAGYRLFGIVVHGGNAYFDQSGNFRTGGHYWAYTVDRFDKNKKWREYNDRHYEFGRELEVGEITEIAQQTKESGGPYMLFYEKEEGIK